MNFLKNLVPSALREALRSATYDGHTPKARASGEGKQKTKKGADHIQGKVFKARQIFPVTPAQYRHLHLAAQKKASK